MQRQSIVSERRREREREREKVKSDRARLVRGPCGHGNDGERPSVGGKEMDALIKKPIKFIRKRLN
jgi:hypothetical protein